MGKALEAFWEAYNAEVSEGINLTGHGYNGSGMKIWGDIRADARPEDVVADARSFADYVAAQYELSPKVQKP